MHRQEMEETGELCLQSESTAYEEDVSMAESREGTELTISMSETDGERGDMSSKVFSIGASFVVPTRTKRPSGSRGTSPAHVRERRNPRQQAELIQAKSKVVQLETEVLVLQRSLKRARIEEEEREESLSSAQQMDRVYKVPNFLLLELMDCMGIIGGHLITMVILIITLLSKVHCTFRAVSYHTRTHTHLQIHTHTSS